MTRASVELNRSSTSAGVVATPPTPTPKEIDAVMREYSEAQTVMAGHKAELKTATETADEIKGRLMVMVQRFGQRHTEKSLRLAGLHGVATLTTATRVSIEQDKVEAFRKYLGEQDIPSLAEKFFSTHISYSMVSGPHEVLSTLDLGARMRTRISSLLGLCFKVVTNAPSLKIETVKAEKPAVELAGT